MIELARAASSQCSRVGSDGGALDKAQTDWRRSAGESQRFHNATFDYIQLQIRTLKERDDELRATVQTLAGGQRRGLQGAETMARPSCKKNSEKVGVGSAIPN